MRGKGTSASQKDAEFVRFTHLWYGFRAGIRTLYTYRKKYNLRTIEGGYHPMKQPPSENATDLYIASVCVQTRFQKEQDIWESKGDVAKSGKSNGTRGVWLLQEEWTRELIKSIEYFSEGRAFSSSSCSLYSDAFLSH